MKRVLLTALFYFFATVFSFSGLANTTPENEHNTYILVHGATGGGWDWKGIDDRLTTNNHQVYRPTLTGLGEKVHLANPEINLTTHINDVVNLILFENLNNVVLVGHSYGGMVITGVMDRIPERIAYVIFLDAVVPDDGMSANDVFGSSFPDEMIIDGQIHFPWLNAEQTYPKDVPQSLKTFTEPVSFNNPKALALPATYVAFVSPKDIELRKSRDSSWKRAKERGWKIVTLDSDHNAQRTHPEELVSLLQTTVKF
ncbi:alpha/beta hydrolase [Alteromonadaceae bacterium BrNp21-10]|nr:alpha/beta hydrolase [Alteromonadaceae bacterium BrNp21-10]